MGTSAWPEEEIAPRNERLLLEAACLRRFGINYLEGAICPDLGLLAHPHGSSVFLLPFCSFGDIADTSPVACVANIDVRPRRSKNPSAGEHARPEEALAFTQPVRGLSWTRGVYTWRDGSTKYDALAVTGAAEVIEGSATRYIGDGVVQEVTEFLPGVFGYLSVACGSDVRLWKVSRFIVGRGEGKGAGGGSRGFRYATTEVLTEWGDPMTDDDKNRKVDRGGGGDGVADDVGANISADKGSQVRREQAESALPVHGSGGVKRQGKSVATCPAEECGGALWAVGSVRGLSFRLVGRRGAGVKAAGAREDEAVPLAAWYDAGAVILRNGKRRSILPAPVANKRACGAWSGCGRRLAVSSGGEIRVYTNPLGKHNAATVDSQRQQPPVAREGWTTSGCREAVGEECRVPLARGEQGFLSGDGTVGQNVSGFGANEVGGSGTGFHTVLCAEAALQGGSVGATKEGRAGYSPCSSPPSPPNPRATIRRTGTAATSPSSPRPVRDGSRRPPASDTALPDHRSAATVDREKGDNHPFSNHSKTSTSVGSASRLIGDIRSMCPAGPEAFFGATDGGLGLRSLFHSSGRSSNRTNDNGSGMNEDSLLGAIVNDSAVRGAAMDAAEAVHSANASLVTPMPTTARSSVDGGGQAAGAEPVVRRGGFRHILPGESWLAGSLRPRSRDTLGVPSGGQLSTHGASPSLGQSPPPSFSSKTNCVTMRNASLASVAGDNALATVEMPRVKMAAAAPAGSDNVSGGASAVAISTLGGQPRPPSVSSTAQVLDLRGKLGGSVFSGMGSSFATAQQHPLFRISFGAGVSDAGMPGAAASNNGDSGVITRNDGGGGGGCRSDAHRGDRNRSTSRRPWLVRVTCSSSCVSDSLPDADGLVGGVQLQALASLPPALASPDLLASSEDGRFVAVGSHACGLVACYRVPSPPRVAAPECVAANVAPPVRRLSPEGNEKHGANFGEGLDCLADAASREVGVGGEGARLRKKTQPRAMPAYTLRLPPGHKAKGLAFVGREKYRTRATDVSGSGSTRIGGYAPGAGGGSGNIGAGDETADDDATVKDSDEAVLLVLAAYPVASVEAPPAYSSSKKGTPTAGRVPLERSSLLGSHDEGSPFRTVLLRFSLPKTTTSCRDGGEKQAGSSASASSPPPTLTDTNATVFRKQNLEAALHPARAFPDEGHDRPPVVQVDARPDGYARDGSDQYSHRLAARSVNAKTVCKRSESSAVGECSIRREGGGELGTVVMSPPRDTLTRQRTMVAPLKTENQSVGGSGRGKTRATHSGLSASSPLRGDVMAGSPTVVLAVGSSYNDDDSVDRFVEEDARRPSTQAGTAGDGAELRLRASILGAIEGVEKRMGQRLDCIERILQGVCERVESLERAVVNNH